MFLIEVLADVSNNNLLLGFMSESLGLLIFGFGLIAFAVLLRWIFNRQKTENSTRKFEREFDKKGEVKIFEGN